MDAGEFWALLDEAREGADGDPGRQAELLTDALARRTPADIVSFDATFHRTRAQGYSWDLWAVGYLAAGGMSDDAFLDFRALLIGRGASVWERAVDDPDSLVDVLGEADVDDLLDEAEPLAYAAMSAYERSTGSPMPTAGGPDDEQAGDEQADDEQAGDEQPDDATPSGLPWDEDDPQGLSKRFPRSWARWGQGETE